MSVTQVSSKGKQMMLSLKAVSENDFAHEGVYVLVDTENGSINISHIVHVDIDGSSVTVLVPPFGSLKDVSFSDVEIIGDREDLKKFLLENIKKYDFGDTFWGYNHHYEKLLDDEFLNDFSGVMYGIVHSDALGMSFHFNVYINIPYIPHSSQGFNVDISFNLEIDGEDLRNKDYVLLERYVNTAREAYDILIDIFGRNFTSLRWEKL